jgi:NTE family protein
MPRRKPIGLALAGGGPFGAVYEVGALMALEDAFEGLRLEELDCYVGVSAGGFLAAALANGIPIREIHRLFILEGEGDGAFSPRVFMRPALREYASRAARLPSLAARLAWQWITQGASPASLASFAALGELVPTGLFDNEPIDRYLESVFTQPGRSNDFRRLRRKLFVIATDLDRGESVTFGREGHDHVPISKAVQASSALPGLFPPVEIDGRFFVDGVLRKTMHASEALEEGAGLVLCVNPIVPYDARLGMRKGGAPGRRLVEGGLPVVLSQTFRAVVHSRMTVGLAKYRGQYPGSDVVLFEPEPDDHEIFVTSLFSYAARQAVCEHAYETTRADLLRRAPVLEPLLARHGIAMRWQVLESTERAMPPVMPRRSGRVGRAAAELDAALRDLKRVIGFAPCSANPTATRSARSARAPGS